MERLSVLSVLEDEQWFDLWSPTTILSSDQYRNTGRKRIFPALNLTSNH